MINLIPYLFFQFSNQFVVFFQQFFGHFNFEFLSGGVFNFETMVTGISNIGEFQVVLDFIQFTAREYTHEDFFIGSQFLNVDLSILRHNRQFFGQGSQGTIVIQQESYLILRLNEALFKKIFNKLLNTQNKSLVKLTLRGLWRNLLLSSTKEPSFVQPLCFLFIVFFEQQIKWIMEVPFK